MLTSGWDSRVMLWSLDPLALPAEQLLRNANLWDLDPEALLQDDQ